MLPPWGYCDGCDRVRARLGTLPEVGAYNPDAMNLSVALQTVAADTSLVGFLYSHHTKDFPGMHVMPFEEDADARVGVAYRPTDKPVMAAFLAYARENVDEWRRAE